MKIKRFQVLRPVIEVEYVRPIIGRLYLMLNIPRMIKFTKQKIKCVANWADGMQGTLSIFNVYYLCIPKIEQKKGK